MTDVNISMNYGVGGEFRLILRDPDDSIAHDTGWFPNTILNSGLVNMANTWFSYFFIGSSSSAVDFTQTALIALLPSGASNSTSGITSTNVNAGSINYEGISTTGRRFIPGNGTGTIREVGIGATSSNSNLSIRALVTPEVTKAANQTLDLYYRFTAWPSLIDQAGSVVIDGDTYDYILRPSTVQDTGVTTGPYGPNLSNATHAAYTGNISALVTGVPSGTTDSCTSVSVTGSGSGFKTYDVYFGLNDGNIGGIRSIRSRQDLGLNVGVDPAIQIQFDRTSPADGAAIPKDSTKEITFNLRLNWSRHP